MPFRPAVSALGDMTRLVGFRGRRAGVSYASGHRYGQSTAASRRGAAARLRKIRTGRVSRRTLTNTIVSKRNPMKPKWVRGAQGGLASFSKLTLSKPAGKKVKAIERAGQSANYLVNSSFSVLCDEGFQNFGCGSTFNNQDMVQIQKKVPANNYVPKPKNVPYQYVISRIHTEYLLTNNTKGTIYCDVYDVIRKRDANNSDASGGTADPCKAWFQGVYNQDTMGTATADLSGSLVLQTLPTDSRLFKDWFKVVQRNKVGLLPGATHRHQVFLRPNKLMDSNLISSVDGDMAGCTVYTMFVIVGQPAVVYDGDDRVVTTANGALDIVQSNRYTYTWILNNEQSYFINDNLVSFGAEQIVQPFSGEVKVVTEA